MGLDSLRFHRNGGLGVPSQLVLSSSDREGGHPVVKRTVAMVDVALAGVSEFKSGLQILTVPDLSDFV